MNRNPASKRLFIAIDLPEEIKKYLREIQAALPADDIAKLVKTRDFHLTLKFLGSCDGNTKKAVEEFLRVRPLPQSFEAQLSKIGVFGSKNFPRVVWVGLDVAPWLSDFQREMESGLTKLGFEAEHRFAPHLTLARVKFVANPKRFSEKMASVAVSPKTFPVTRYSLFQSHLSPHGATYERLADF